MLNNASQPRVYQLGQGEQGETAGLALSNRAGLTQRGREATVVHRDQLTNVAPEGEQETGGAEKSLTPRRRGE